MTPTELEKFGRLLYGPFYWQTELARALPVNPRSVRAWLANKKPIPKDLPERLVELGLVRRGEIDRGIKEIKRRINGKPKSRLGHEGATHSLTYPC